MCINLRLEDCGSFECDHYRQHLLGFCTKIRNQTQTKTQKWDKCLGEFGDI